MYVDTHCHLDSKEYTQNLDSVIANALTLGVEKIIIPGADIASLPRAITLSETYPHIYFASGIHPSEIESFDEDTKNTIQKALSHDKCVAVGEVGLDYHYLDSAKESEIKHKQELALRFQIQLAIESNKPIIIHTRDSNDDIIKILSDYDDKIKAVIFHCFGGDLRLIGALKCPCYYGIGGVISFKNATTLKENIKKIPLHSLLLETDAPYLAPTPHRGKINSPEFIPLIASYLADCLQCDINEIAEITTKNANNVFGF